MQSKMHDFACCHSRDTANSRKGLSEKKGAPTGLLSRPPPRGVQNSTWPTPHYGAGQALPLVQEPFGSGWRFREKQFLKLALRQIVSCTLTGARGCPVLVSVAKEESLPGTSPDSQDKFT